ncbi:MAG: CARDB domain-containing protein [Planctomycetota bacterium]
MINDLSPSSIGPGTSAEHFSIKITPDGPYFPWERIASPQYHDGLSRPYIQVQYNLSTSSPVADLTLYENLIETDPVWPKPETKIALNATIRNTGAATARDVRVEFYDGDPAAGGVFLGSDVVPTVLAGGGQALASIDAVAIPGNHDIHVVVDPGDVIKETDETNNAAVASIPILETYQSYLEGFESGFGDWRYDFDTPREYLTGWNKLSYIQPTRDEIYAGKQALYAYLDGNADDGTVWIERTVPVPRYTLLEVELKFAFGIQADLATTLMYFIDTFDPEAEMDFEEAGMANGWKMYKFTKTVYTEDNNTLWLAGGFTARWETELSKYMDEFSIKISKIE